MFPLTFDGLLLVTVGFVVVRFVVAVGDGSHCGMLQTVTAVCFLPGLGHVHVSFLITSPSLACYSSKYNSGDEMEMGMRLASVRLM